MNKSELVEKVAQEANLTKADTERAINATIDTIIKALAKGDSVTLIGFGTFKVATRAARTGVNPKTGEKLQIAAANVPRFTPGQAFKAALNTEGKKKKKA